MEFEPKRILLIQLRQIGDALLTAPAAAVLRANFPSAQLDFLAQPPCQQPLERNPDITNLISYNPARPFSELLKIRAGKYDLVIDFMSNPRSALLTAFSGARIKAGPAYTSSAWAYNVKLREAPGQKEYNPFFKIDLLRQLGIKNIFYPYPQVYPLNEDLNWAQEEAPRLRGEAKKIIAFSPASRRITRQWPKEHFAKLAQLVYKDCGAKTVICWGPGERALAETIVSLAGPLAAVLAPPTTSLSRLSALLKQTVLLVSNCNGAKHVAQASDVPTLGIYGSSRPESWTPPDDPRHQVVRKDSPGCCIACQKNDCSKAVECLTKLTPETVFAKLIRMI